MTEQVSESPEHDHDEDGYTGPVELIAGETIVTAQVQLTGHFDPISGQYSWYGRLDVSPDVDALVASGVQKVELVTPIRRVATRLSDIDPWGRYRVEGFGEPPFEVVTELDESDDH
jgi:hypothetical protein